MFRQITRWILATLALSLVALYLLLSPILPSHAAPKVSTPHTTVTTTSSHHAPLPNSFWRP